MAKEDFWLSKILFIYDTYTLKDDKVYFSLLSEISRVKWTLFSHNDAATKLFCVNTLLAC
jgi:hypothetical protein